VRESLPVSDRVAGSKSACTSISLWFHLVRSVWPPYSMTELTQESDLYRYKDHSDERPCKSIRTEHRQAADSLGTFLPSRASDITRPSSTRVYEGIYLRSIRRSSWQRGSSFRSPSSFYLSSKADLAEIDIDNPIPYSTDAFRPHSIL
jgi:hypothetical protein